MVPYIGTFVPFSMFAEWQAIPPGERGPAYAELKERIAAWMLSASGWQ